MRALLASLALLLWLLSYAALCMAQPFPPCKKCAGLGKTLAEGKKKPKTCKRCGGKGAKLRRGRRMHNAWRQTHERGTR